MLTTHERRKRLRSRWLQKHLINLPVTLLVWPGLLRGHAILETVGGKTGKLRRVVVGVSMDDAGSYWIVAEHGQRAGYVRNIAANATVRLRVDGRWLPASAEAVPSDDVDKRLTTFSRLHARAVRRFGTRLLSVRVAPM
jgi:deazaflavin-dependent oxidoreductase (nitroreductase family)